MLTLANRLSNMLVYLAIRFSGFIRDATWNTAVRRFWASPSLSVTSEENGCCSWPTLLLARGPQLNFSFGPQRKKSFCTLGLDERSRGQQNIIQPPRMRQISWSRRRFDQFPGRLMKYSHFDWSHLLWKWLQLWPLLQGYSADSVYQMTHFVPTLNTECHFGWN